MSAAKATVYSFGVLTWTHTQNPTNPKLPVPQESELETWHTTGGDAMAVVSKKGARYELVAWWVNGGGSLTPTKVVFLSLDKAQEEAERLIFQRVDDWSRLLED